ncbi:hypothetical protein MtrunA17_Chr4g0056221 [Medicago truncatula]|uniref:Transmembrane protein n=1 Tax=Medicago truncatula TaxID=3880 RepID=A0A396IHI9_MEDTR|nr:hypothetical protein MtrunA17_Chr4g0056221 [Medicago truncatula]
MCNTIKGRQSFRCSYTLVLLLKWGLTLPQVIETRKMLKFLICNLRFCLRVCRGREGKAWEKRNEQVEEIEENEMGEFWGLTFLRNIKPSSFWGTKNLHWRGFWGAWEGLYEILQI